MFCEGNFYFYFFLKKINFLFLIFLKIEFNLNKKCWVGSLGFFTASFFFSLSLFVDGEETLTCHFPRT